MHLGQIAPIGFVVTLDDGEKLVAYGVSMQDAVDFVRNTLDEPIVVVAVERCQLVDQFTPGPAPVKTLVEELGFVFGCFNCETPIDDNMFDYEEDRELTPLYNDEMQIAFCCPECALEFDEDQKKKFN